jgi:hypothetical protein
MMVHMMRMAFPLLIVVSGCSEFNFSSANGADGPVPNIRVQPLTLAYGERATGEEEVQVFTVINVGSEALHLSAVEVSSGLAFDVLTDLEGVSLLKDESMEVEVRFRPMVSYENLGQLLVVSDDPDESEVPVDLTGRGITPELEIDPPFYDFGDALIPCAEDVSVALRNVGREPLEILSLDYAGDQMVLHHEHALPVTLEPGEEVGVSVTYEPSVEGGAIGTMSVESNDPRGVLTGDQQGESGYGGTAVDGFEIPDDPPVDILFAVDQSCSMNADQVILGDAFSAFIRDVEKMTHGWQIGVVTIDNACFNEGILDTSTPSLYSVFADAVQRTGGLFQNTLSESLLQLSAKAAGKTGLGGCNQDFLRDNALLHVIVVSDEREQSGDPERYAQELIDLKSTPDLVKISAVVDVTGDCGDQGVNNGPGGYLEAVNVTGGLLLDICDAAWGDRAPELAEMSLIGIGEYILSETPDEDTLEVYIDGEIQTEGWTYKPSSNSIDLDATLDGGEFIEIFYRVLGECEPS